MTDGPSSTSQTCSLCFTHLNFTDLLLCNFFSSSSATSTDIVWSYCFTENADGKYISPFHDIPMFANESQVSVHLWPRPFPLYVHTICSMCMYPLIAIFAVCYSPRISVAGLGNGFQLGHSLVAKAMACDVSIFIFLQTCIQSPVESETTV